MKFPYIQHAGFDRTLILARLTHGTHELEYEVLVDTGADHSVIHIELAAELGFTIPRVGLVEVIGVAGATPGFIATLDLGIGSMTLPDVPVIFADLGPRSFGILGHAGLFRSPSPRV